MAGLTDRERARDPGRNSARDRGQILLVAAFALAVTFVALAVVVNSAILTGNLATRGETTGASDALTSRHEIAGNVENVTASVNKQNTSDLVDNVDASIGNMSDQGGLQQARRGRVVNVSLDDSSPRVRARSTNNATAAFTNASGAHDWTLVTDGDRILDAEFNVSDANASDEADAFHLFVNESGGPGHWELAVFENATATDTYNLTVRDGSTFLAACEPEASADFTINLTAGFVSDDTGTVCTNALDDANRTYTGFGGKDVAFGEANNLTGNYTVTVERDGATPGVDTGNYNETSPTVAVWIERLQVEYTYESPSVRYETEITVRPGESG
ncbi:hypothetical protein BRD09_07015 [Halobacteriales archaeon SW_10_68_16]|nr:MAG: hypothetical protein BRD09_07015 [Halobacteriales archaeon SW_10_68_16]